MSTHFWDEKTLAQLSAEQWELLCDGCARCCLVKLEDEDSGEIYHTDLACQLLDIDTCRCSKYATRHQWVDDCIQLNKGNIRELSWLPETCAYRCVGEGRPLPEWHPLLTGGREAMHEAGASVRGQVISEQHVHPDEVQDHIIQWVD